MSTEKNLSYCFTLWEVTLDTERNLVTDVKGRIIGVNKKGRKIDFYFRLQLEITLCGQTDSLSKTLQSVRISLWKENAWGGGYRLFGKRSYRCPFQVVLAST